MSVIGFIFLVISIVLLCLEESRKSLEAIIVYLITILFAIFIICDKKKHLNNLVTEESI